MARIDLNAIVAQLEDTRKATAQDLADIDAVLATVRARAGRGAAAAPARRVKAKATAAPAAKGGRGNGKRASAEELEARKAKAKKLWERDQPVGAIAKATGATVSSIYKWSSEGKWQRPKPGTAVSPAGDGAVTSAGARFDEPRPLGGRVRCTSCESMTSMDPCEYCGNKLKKSWR